MKRFVLAGLAALAAVTTMSSANAADIARRMPTKAPVAYTPAYNWTGGYVGLNGGGAWGNSDLSALIGSSSTKTSGALVGGTIGYNYQMGQTVFGLEGDLDWSNLKGTSAAAPCTTSCESSNSWLGTARGRIGYAFDRVMPFVTGGAAFGDVKFKPTGFTGSDDTKVGWTLGGGSEFAIAGPWTAKVEYLYVDLGKLNCPAGACATSTEVNFHSNVVRAGLNYRF